MFASLEIYLETRKVHLAQQAGLYLAGSSLPNLTWQEWPVYPALEDWRSWFLISSSLLLLSFPFPFVPPRLAGTFTPRRARTEHRRVLIWSNFKTGAGARGRDFGRRFYAGWELRTIWPFVGCRDDDDR